MIRTVRVIVTGRVQGVGYRAWVEREAARRALSGWVRNRRDGSVEALFSGEAAAVEAMAEACRAGSRHSSVETIVVEAAADEPAGGGFRTIATV